MANFKSLPENGRSMQRLGLQKKRPLLRDRILGTWQKKLIVGTILTSSLFFSGAAARKAFAETVTITKLNEENKEVSAERYITYEGEFYHLRVKAKPGANYLDAWLDGEYGKIPISKEFKKFDVTKIIIGNPSIMIVGIDEKGNYGFIIWETLIGHSRYQNIRSELPAKRLEELGMKQEIKYDEKKRVYVVNLTDKDGKLIAYAFYSEDGRRLESAGMSEEEFFGKYLPDKENN